MPTDSPAAVVRFGSMYSIQPLQVLLDGDDDPTPISVTLVAPTDLNVGSYVAVTMRPLRYGSMQAVLSGKVGGTPTQKSAPLPAPGEVHKAGPFTAADKAYVYQDPICCGVAFLAPPSGTVIVEHSVLAKPNVANQGAGMSMLVVAGNSITDPVFMSSDPSKSAAINFSAFFVSVSRSRVVSGMNPGSKYAAFQLAYLAAGGGTLQWSSLSVVPLGQNS